ncbi:MAG: SDR family oxidoreductase [Bacteroidota bacterium]
MNDFSNKTYLVTGASSGIGSQVAIDIASAGGKVILTGRSEEKLKSVFGKLQGSGHISISCDLTDEILIKNLLDKIPAIDGFVHSAGVSPMVPVRFIKLKQSRDVFAINYEAALLLISGLLALKKINKDGSLVFISSLSTTQPLFGGALYTASKLALEGLSKTLALELQPKKIRANCICPAYVFSPMVDEANKNLSVEFMEQFQKMHPDGFGYPENVSSVILFLLSESSKWVNGRNIPLGSFNINIPAL